MRAELLMLLLGSTLACGAQTQMIARLPGTVVDQNGRGVYGVWVEVTSDSYDTTGSSGDFVITLKEPVAVGSRIHLNIDMQGWIVKEPKDGWITVPSTTAANPLLITMEKIPPPPPEPKPVIEYKTLTEVIQDLKDDKIEEETVRKWFIDCGQGHPRNRPRSDLAHQLAYALRNDAKTTKCGDCLRLDVLPKHAGCEVTPAPHSQSVPKSE